MRPLPFAAAFLAAVPTVVVTAAPASAQGDPDVVAALVEEGTERSQVWSLLTHLCHQIGPRLTGSAGLEAACTWTRGRFTDFGLSNAHLFKWGEVPVRFDRGPSTLRMVSPAEVDFEFTTNAWMPGTAGPLRGKVVKLPTTLDQLEAVRDDLPGAWVLVEPSARRARPRRGDEEESEEQKAEREAREVIDAAVASAGIAGRMIPSRNDQITTGGVRGFLELTLDSLPKEREVRIRRVDYDTLNSRLADGETVEVEADLVHYFTEGPFPVFDVVAEIPGTEFPDQVVILSAHLDSWNGPGSQGCQDNGTGAMVMLEAARILGTVGVKPRRTIRICLWSGEEQGLYGSRIYAEHLQETGELAGVSACFVDDGGTGYQGGLVCTSDMEPMLAEAIAPVNAAFPEYPVDIQVQDSMPRGGSSDHASFNRLGVPGFYWTEKGLTGREARDYRFVWHTQNDTTRYAVEENLVQSAVCSAVTAYNLAMADTLLPRYVEPTEAEAVEAEAERASGVVGEVVEGPLSGKWKGVVTSGDLEGWEFGLSFVHGKDGALSMELEVMGSGGPFEEASYDAETKTFRGRYESESYGTFHYEGTLQDDGSLLGKSRTASGERPFKATRAKTTGDA